MSESAEDLLKKLGVNLGGEQTETSEDDLSDEQKEEIEAVMNEASRVYTTMSEVIDFPSVTPEALGMVSKTLLARSLISMAANRVVLESPDQDTIGAKDVANYFLAFLEEVANEIAEQDFPEMMAIMFAPDEPEETDQKN